VPSDSSSPRPGLVLRIDARHCHVELDGRTVVLPLRGRLFEQRGAERGPIAVGDRVLVTWDGASGAIDAVLPRTSRLARRAAGGEEREHVLAANVSLVLAVASLEDPPFEPLLLDGILAGAAREGLDAAVALTKADLDAGGRAVVAAATYRALEYPTFVLSTRARASPQWDDLGRLLAAHVTVVCGTSGAGKSSLLNELLPGVELATGEVGHHSLGRHTTTHTRLLPLPSVGHVLDTPGIRSFDLAGAAPTEIGPLFREIAAHAAGCAFRDCTHRVEPDCAVQRALQADRIAPSRFASYVAIVQQRERERQRRPGRGGLRKRR
jgi:ribosome biogenesis GTPase